MKEQPNKPNIRHSPVSRDSQVTTDGIRAQLDHVLSSPDFKASKKVKTIFRYLTEETLTESGDQINAQRIADRARNRPLDPDPQLDAVARIQMNQLRRALKG